jgi:phosphate starvation-inducible PhoH-like protein
VKPRREAVAPQALELALLPEDNQRLAALCGPLDQNLRLIEQRLGVEVRRRGNQFRVAGTAAGGAAQVLRDLFELTAGNGAVELPDVHLALREHEIQEDAGDAVRAAPVIPLPGDDAARVPRGVIRARGEHQKRYLASIHGHDLTFGIGPAGTGKTYLAVACAVEALHSERVRRIVLVRPAVEAGERLGFLPGDLTQKVDPYLRPMYDALYEMMGFDRVARFIERNIIEVAPLAFMRGRSLNESFIILDEAQNTTPEQMKMFLTRIGFGSRAVVTGDITQTDLPAGKLSGLRHALQVLPGVAGVAFSHFDAGDVVRHPLVQRIVRAYEERGDAP